MTLDGDTEALLRQRMSEGPLLTLRLDIINKCNLRCVMCHYSDPEIALRPAKVLTIDEFDAWFRDIGPHTRDVMLSCGDEPLMSPHFAGILEKVSASGNDMDVGICTNGMLMNSKLRSAMIQHGLTYALFSMDGATKRTMERIRVKSDFERVVGNIKALKRLKEKCGSGYPKFILDFVMMRSNVREAAAFVEIGYYLGAELVDFRHAIPSAYWDDEEEKLENYPEVYNYYRDKIVERGNRLGVRVTLPDPYEGVETGFAPEQPEEVSLEDFHAAAPDRDPQEWPVPKKFDPEFVSRKPLQLHSEYFGTSYCERPFSEILIRNQTEVLPCAWHGKTLGELSGDATLKDIFLGPGFADLRAKMLRGEVDAGCRHCPVKKGFLPTEIATAD